MADNKTINEYLNLQTCSNNRIKKIRNILEKSKKIMGKDLTKLQESDVAAFLRYINNKSNFTTWTKNDYKKVFKGFLKCYYKNKILEWLEKPHIKEGFKITTELKAFNKDRINKNTLITNEELERLLRTAKSLKWKALLTLLYESAFRPCELVALKWKNLTFDDTNNLCKVSIVSPKTNERREVPVRNCIVHLKRWRDEFQFPNRTKDDFVFPGQIKRDKHLSEAALSMNIKRICRRAGIREIFSYMFRHTRIYEIQKSIGGRLAAKFGGHSLKTSEIYNHLDNEDVTEAMLQKVYTTEELTEEQKDELKQMREENKEVKEKMKKLENMLNSMVNKTNKEEGKKEVVSG